MQEPLWLSRSVVGIIHSDQIRQHGGSFGIRDEGLIQSALDRPKNKWAYEAKIDLADLAAAYGFGLVANHGFVDGNKRVGFMALYTFLGLNDRELFVEEPQAVLTMLSLAASRMSETELAVWIREHWRRSP